TVARELWAGAERRRDRAAGARLGKQGQRRRRGEGRIQRGAGSGDRVADEGRGRVGGPGNHAGKRNRSVKGGYGFAKLRGMILNKEHGMRRSRIGQGMVRGACLALTMAAGALGGCAWGDAPFEQTTTSHSPAPGTGLKVDARNGSIAVHKGDGG